MPATDIQFEREFEELVRDLRALPTAGPPELRDRVRALGEPTEPRTVRDLLLAIPWRRSLLVLAPVCVLGLVSAAVIHGVLHSGKTNQVASVTSARAALDSGVNGTAGSGLRGRGRPRRCPAPASSSRLRCLRQPLAAIRTTRRR